MANTRVRILCRLLVYLAVTLGFVYQSFWIGDEFFAYPTTTLVSIVDALPVTTPPTLAFCARAHRQERLWWKNVSNHYNPGGLLHDKVTFKNAFYRVDNMVLHRSRRYDVVIRRFYRDALACLTIKLKDDIQLKPQAIHLFINSPIYKFTLMTDILKIKATNHGGMIAHFFVLMTSRHSGDFEGLLKTPAMLMVYLNWNVLEPMITYNIQTVTLLPPPYDTNCRNYSRSGFTSRDNCYSQCLNGKVKRHGFISESTVIAREKYENSSLKILPWFLTHPTIGKKYLNSHPDVAILLPRVERYRQECQMKCSQKDCYKESLVPIILANRHFRYAGKFLSLTVELYPPNQSAVVVKSTPKLSIIDFIVYVFSILSFWFGFCPLSSTRYLRGQKVTNRVVPEINSQINYRHRHRRRTKVPRI